MKIPPHQSSSVHLAFLVTFLGLASAAEAQTYSVLYSFSGYPSDGANPYGSLIQSGDVLYGLTSLGGVNQGGGTIFQYNLATNTESVLHSFSFGSGDGVTPYGSLIQSGSELYGVTSTGGSSSFGAGTIFQYDLATNTESVLHSFNSAQDSTDGIIPDGSLIQSGSILYGTTSGSAHPVRSPYYAGTIFQYDLTTDAESVLYTSQQYSPVGSVIQSGPNLYGVQGGPFGGGGGGYGMIFQYNLAAGTETVLHSFVGGPGDGNYPGASLIQSGSVLYGVTSAGGASGEGAIFEYDLATNTESLVYSFAGGTADGAGPEGSLIQFGSVLYGMTYGGGADGFGAIFQFNLTTDAESVLHSFAGGTGDGENSQLNCSLILSGSTLYGMTPQGGTGKDGVIFSLTVPEPAMGSMLLITGAAMLMQRKRE